MLNVFSNVSDDFIFLQFIKKHVLINKKKKTKRRGNCNIVLFHHKILFTRTIFFFGFVFNFFILITSFNIVFIGD
jgi:hypothetical protein